MSSTTGNLKTDPCIPGQKFALISMIEPKNKKLLKNKESFYATHFLHFFLQENNNVCEYEAKNGTEALTDMMKEKKNLDYDNIQMMYYEYLQSHSNHLDNEFNKLHNPKNEMVISGFKIRGVYPEQNETLQQDIEKFHNYEPYVDIYTAPIGQWVPYCPADTTDIISVQYAHEKLTAMLDNKKKNMKMQKKAFNERLQNQNI
jgi:hypothetical protein